MHIVYYTTVPMFMSPWRNWLARSAVNRKVDGSIPSGDVLLDPINIIELIKVKHAYSLLYNRSDVLCLRGAIG